MEGSKQGNWCQRPISKIETSWFFSGGSAGQGLHSQGSHERWGFALCGLTVVGWCDIVRLYFHPGYEHNGRLGIGVLAAWRGQGLGRALLDHALSAASGTGFRRVELEVYASNTAALSLNKICGFTVEGLKRAMRLFDGRVEEVVLMACSLTDGFPEPLLHG